MNWNNALHPETGFPKTTGATSLEVAPEPTSCSPNIKRKDSFISPLVFQSHTNIAILYHKSMSNDISKPLHYYVDLLQENKYKFFFLMIQHWLTTLFKFQE